MVFYFTTDSFVKLCRLFWFKGKTVDLDKVEGCRANKTVNFYLILTDPVKFMASSGDP